MHLGSYDNIINIYINLGDTLMGLTKVYRRTTLVDIKQYQDNPAYRYFINTTFWSLCMALLGMLLMLSMFAIFILVVIVMIILQI